MPAVVAKEIKEEILMKIKNGGKASEIADHYGVHRKTVYGWLGGAARSHVSFKEYQKMRKERDGLLALVGELLLKTKSSGGKNGSW
jgi:transposase